MVKAIRTAIPVPFWDTGVVPGLHTPFDANRMSKKLNDADHPWPRTWSGSKKPGNAI